MFERFSEEARQVLVLAQEEARILKHAYIGTEHLLLALLREEEGGAARVLYSLEVTVEKVRRQVIQIIGSGEEVPSGQFPFTPRAKKVVDLAVREAASLGHHAVDTEHLLLGLLKEREGVAARILLDLGVMPEAIRQGIVEMLREKRSGAKPVQMPPTPLRRSPEVDMLLDMAAREAESDGSPEIRLRHLVRGLAEFFGR